MLFLVQFRFRPESRDALLAHFEQHGPNPAPGIEFRNGWVSRREHLVFAVYQCDAQDRLEQALAQQRQFGELTIHPVLNLDEL